MRNSAEKVQEYINRSLWPLERDGTLLTSADIAKMSALQWQVGGIMALRDKWKARTGIDPVKLALAVETEFARRKRQMWPAAICLLLSVGIYGVLVYIAVHQASTMSPLIFLLGMGVVFLGMWRFMTTWMLERTDIEGKMFPPEQRGFAQVLSLFLLWADLKLKDLIRFAGSDLETFATEHLVHRAEKIAAAQKGDEKAVKEAGNLSLGELIDDLGLRYDTLKLLTLVDPRGFGPIFKRTTG